MGKGEAGGLLKTLAILAHFIFENLSEGLERNLEKGVEKKDKKMNILRCLSRIDTKLRKVFEERPEDVFFGPPYDFFVVGFFRSRTFVFYF